VQKQHGEEGMDEDKGRVPTPAEINDIVMMITGVMEQTRHESEYAVEWRGVKCPVTREQREAWDDFWVRVLGGRLEEI
jgi:hypothetical protein